jgi:pilus assembly protein CpaD
MIKSNSRYLRGGRWLLIAAVSALAVTGCKHAEPGTRIAGWTLVDPAQRHPILVSEEPISLPIRVTRGSSGLSPNQRARILDYYTSFRSSGAVGRIVVQAPSGSSNELAALHATHEIRALLISEGASEADISVEAYHDDGRSNPPILLTYTGYVAEAPDCGIWPTNLAREPGNLPYPNLGCATQRNLAAQIANPSDLLRPRGMTDRSSERRDVVWNKYLKGDKTSSAKTRDERIQIRKSN